MTAAAITVSAPVESGIGLLAFTRQTLWLTWRGLRTIPRVPERLLDVTIQPIVFILLFLYVFGSAIHVAGVSYKDFLFPGILAQTLAFGIFGAGTYTANDMQEGVVDRFRSMPISRLAIIWSEVLCQMVEALLGLAITAGLGFALGWNPHLSVAGAFALMGLVLLALLAFTWLGVLFGMLVRSSDAVQGIGFIVIFPLTFLAGTFVPINGMAAVPRAIGHWDPVSAFVAAVRHLTTPGIGTSTGSWQLTHPLLAAALWCVLLIAIAMPLALWRFNRRLS
ncbi:MAG: ABC transporter permease [Solirubrobacterales bacterium]|nr:ABC transporter permease [Solirubrobacterales bacterium]